MAAADAPGPSPHRAVLISAPSGAGKTTILKRMLAAMPELTFSISATTRPQRAGEVDGRDYYFLTEEDFRAKQQANAFVEWEEVYPGRYYGTLWAELERIRSLGQTPVFEVDVNGGHTLKQQFGPQALGLFIKPPSVEALRERLQKRGTENAADLQARLARAEEELAHAHHFDAVVVNHDLDAAVEEALRHVRHFLDAQALAG